jgi:hypothetical protein
MFELIGTFEISFKIKRSLRRFYFHYRKFLIVFDIRKKIPDGPDLGAGRKSET